MVAPAEGRGGGLLLDTRPELGVLPGVGPLLQGVAGPEPMQQGKQFGGGELAGAPLLQAGLAAEQLEGRGGGHRQEHGLGAAAQVLERAVVQQADPAGDGTGFQLFQGAGLGAGIGPGAEAAQAAALQDPDLFGQLARG